MNTAVPYTPGPNGGGRLFIPAGATLSWGHAFDPECGYRVSLWFEGSTARNVMTAETARAIARDRLDHGRPQQAQIAAVLVRLAEQVERLNAGWVAAGRPAGSLDALPAGRA